MPAPVLTREQWEEVRRAYEAGVSIRELSEYYGVSVDSIHQKSHRGQWINVEALESQERARLKKQSELGFPKRLLSVEPPKALEVISESLSEIADRNALRAAQTTDSAFSRLDPNSLSINGWKDLSTALAVLWKASGRDKNAAVTLNFGDWGAASPDSLEVRDVP